MTLSFSSFTEELLLIKKAESEEAQAAPVEPSAAPVIDEERPTLFGQLRRRVTCAIPYGLGYGLGAASGALLGAKLLPKVLPAPWSDTRRKFVRNAAGVLGAMNCLAVMEAMRRADRADQNVRK
jgi:hypothetical protein